MSKASDKQSEADDHHFFNFGGCLVDIAMFFVIVTAIAFLLAGCGSKNPVTPEPKIEISSIENMKGFHVKKTLALAVGCNLFPKLEGNTLYGCANDAKAMYDFFMTNYDNCTCSVYTDSLAKKNNIMSTLGVMVSLAITDRNVTNLLFSISSHGSQIPDADGDEVDGVDECVLINDSKLRGIGLDRKSVIVDDELRTLFAKVPARVTVEVWLDACFSGTGLRKIGSNSRYRFFRNPAIVGTSKAKTATAFSGTQQSNVILWSGCTDKEYSSDAYINGQFQGAMTASFLQSFGEKKKRSKINFDMQRYMINNDYDQTPQLECLDALKNKIMVK